MNLKIMIQKNILKFTLTFIYLLNNELLLLNAATTYYALLSFIPLILTLSIIIEKIAIISPEALNLLNILSENISNLFNIELDISNFFGQSKKIGLGLFGTISVFLTSTLFLRTINKIFRKIFRIKTLKETILHTIMPFILYILFLIFIFIAILIKTSLVIIEKYLVFYFDIDFSTIITILEKVSAIPLIIFFIISTLTYYFLSMRKIGILTAIKISLYLMISIYILNLFFKNFYNIAFYNAIYGTLSSIIITLAYVYFFFMFFIYWAQYSYVSSKFESVIIKYFFEEFFKKPDSKIVNQLAKFLKDNIIVCNKDQILNIKELNNDLAIVLKGSFELTNEDEIPIYINRLDFFNIQDISDKVIIKASEDSLILTISEEQKRFLLEDSSIASAIFHSNEKLLII